MTAAIMDVIQIRRQDEFEAKIDEAQSAHTEPPLRVLRMSAIEPVTGEEGTLDLRPAVVIDYVQELRGKQYRYREVCVADQHGIINLYDAPLWKRTEQMLRGDQGHRPTAVLTHRSGSL